MKMTLFTHELNLTIDQDITCYFIIHSELRVENKSHILGWVKKV